MALHDYKETKNILSVAFDDQSNMLREQMGQLNTTLTTVRDQARGDRRAPRRAGQGQRRRSERCSLRPSCCRARCSRSCARGYVDAHARARRRSLSGGKGKNHPDVQAAAGARRRLATRRSSTR